MLKRLSSSQDFCLKDNRFSSKLTFFQKVFPFNHFVTLRGKLLKNGQIELVIMPIFVRVMQASVVSMMALILSAVRLYDSRSWAVLGIFALHFTTLCTVWFVLRILYVTDARVKVYRAKRRLRLVNEE